MSVPFKRAAADTPAGAPAAKRQITGDVGIPSDEAASTPSTSASTSMNTTRADPPHPPAPTGPRPGDPRRTNQGPSTLELRMTKLIGAPTPLRYLLPVIVDTMGYVGFFKLVYNVYLDEYNPYYDGIAPPINQDKFVHVCRYLLYARIHNVFSQITGQRKANRIAFPAQFIIGQPIATIIQDTGVLPLPSRGLVLVPEPEPSPEDPGHRWVNQVGFQDLTNFQDWMNQLRIRRGLRVETVSNTPDGTAYWSLAATQPASGLPGTLNDDALVIKSSHLDWTPRDGIHALLIARGNQIIPTDNARFGSEVLSLPAARSNDWIREQFSTPSE
jgi:hypothetical protein